MKTFYRIYPCGNSLIEIDPDLALSIEQHVKNGRPFADNWQRPAWLNFCMNFQENDFCVMQSHFPVLSSRASEALADHLSPHGELLPLDPDESLFYFHTTTPLSLRIALNGTERSYKDFCPIGFMVDFSFFKHFQAEMIFRIRESFFDLYATQILKDLVDNAGLTGLEFQQVWPSLPGN